jgi:hypothetical protein
MSSPCFSSHAIDEAARDHSAFRCPLLSKLAPRERANSVTISATIRSSASVSVGIAPSVDPLRWLVRGSSATAEICAAKFHTDEQRVQRHDLEGIVAKRRNDAYTPSARWLKIQNPRYSQAEGRGELFNPPKITRTYFANCAEFSETAQAETRRGPKATSRN